MEETSWGKEEVALSCDFPSKLGNRVRMLRDAVRLDEGRETSCGPRARVGSIGGRWRGTGLA
uniref:Uncharacterized protein n=1 Tax=Nymphaea colorata TaxID=210225 RepID=A0A5K1H5W0_9MAGN|nr:unnamed protein product [Nymphaea colorata]